MRIERLERLGGGAIQDNFALDVELVGGDMDGQHALVLRTDAPSSVAVSHSRPHEFALLGVANAAGLTVPEPLWCDDGHGDRRAFFLMRRLPGTADGGTVARSLGGTRVGEALAAQLGVELARLHRVRPPQPALDFLPLPAGNPALARVKLYRRYLDALPKPEPVPLRSAHRQLPRRRRPPVRHTGLGVRRLEPSAGRRRLVLRAQLALRQLDAGGGRHRRARASLRRVRA